MLESIGQIERYTEEMSIEEFVKSDQVCDAVLRRLEIIGEATKNLPEEMKIAHGEIEWRDISDFRNFLIHEYFGVDIQEVWSVIKKDLPVLKKQIQNILDEKEKESS